MRLKVFALAAVLASANGGAIAEGDPKVCAKQKDDTKRLLCYDLIFKMEPTAAPKTDIPTDWRTQIEKSKIDDSTGVFMEATSQEIIDCGWNRGGRITLSVRCRENTTSLIFSTGCHMTSSRYNRYGDVTYRLDDDKAKTVGMQESSNNRALGLWTGAQSIPVIKQMFGKKQMLARMTPYNKNSFTATFKIAGLEEAIKPLRNACSW